MPHSLASVHDSHGIVARRLGHILIVLDAEFLAQVLRTADCEDDDIEEYAAHEDTDDFPVLVSQCLAFGRQRESFTGCRFDGRRGGRHEITELVARADDECSEGARGELHEMDGNDAPSALDAELLEEGCGDDGVR